jgi:small ligand-binding sensory domain FIST
MPRPQVRHEAAMRFASALAADADLEAACDTVAASVRRRLPHGPIDLLVVFASARYGTALRALPTLLHERLAARTLVGCTGGVVGTEITELADAPALAVLAAQLPGVDVDATLVADADLPNADAPPDGWRRLLPANAGSAAALLVFAEPFHGDLRSLLAGLDFAFPLLPKLGGIASGSRHPDGNCLFLGRTTHHRGALLVTLRGALQVDRIIAPGCRPFGRVGRISQAQGNRLLRIDGQPARQFISEQLRSLQPAEREVAAASPLFLGLAGDPFAVTAPQPDDFVLRNIVGMTEAGEMVVTDHLALGRQLQLHMRDPQHGEADLRQRLAQAAAAGSAGALMFRCLGRTENDRAVFAATAEAVPLIGCHCNGEIGAAAGTTQLLGFTASIALLRPHRELTP